MEQYDVINAQAQMRKGVWEIPILLIIGAREVYASEIIEALKNANLHIVEGTLYPLLTRLKRFGLLSYEWKESKSGPPRKYYKITDEGKRVLSELKASWEDLNGAITQLTKKYEKSN